MHPADSQHLPCKALVFWAWDVWTHWTEEQICVSGCEWSPKVHLVSSHLCVKLHKPPTKRPKPSFFSNSMYLDGVPGPLFPGSKLRILIFYHYLPFWGQLHSLLILPFLKIKGITQDIHNVPFTWGAAATTRSCCLSKSTSELISVSDRKELKN